MRRIYFNDPKTFEEVNGKRDSAFLWRLHNILFMKWLKQIDNKDMNIILLKQLGYKQMEIGEILQESQSSVSQRLKILKKSYKRFFNIK